MSPARHHLLSVLVENKAGVLTRVASLFARRGYNIFSLAVAPTDDPRFSRISIVVDVESAPLDQVVAQLDKLINVVDISELRPDEAREAELLLATVSADAGKRAEVIQLVSVFGGRIVDVGHDALMVMLAGAPEVLDDFEELIRPYSIVELQRTGRVALGRLSPGAGAGAGGSGAGGSGAGGSGAGGSGGGGSGAGAGGAGSSAAAGGTVIRAASA